jgi:hypothetical protein
MRSDDIQRHPLRRHPRLEMALFSRVAGQERREDIDELMQELREVAEALHRAERKLAAIEAMDGLDAEAVRRATTHVRLLARPAGYALVEADEPPPEIGEVLEYEGEQFAVECLRPSPFPGDRRRCAVLGWLGARDSEPPTVDPLEPEPDTGQADTGRGDTA